MYCATEGLENPTGDCDSGYYCPEGQDTATPAAYTCPVAHFCLSGVAEATPCASGSYQVRQYYRYIYILSF